MGKHYNKELRNICLLLTKEGAAFLTKEGKLVTTYSSAYFDENIKNIVNQLYGKLMEVK